MKCDICNTPLTICEGSYYGDTGVVHTAYCIECHTCMKRTGYYSDLKEVQEEYLAHGFDTELTEEELREVV